MIINQKLLQSVNPLINIDVTKFNYNDAPFFFQLRDTSLSSPDIG